MSAGGAGDARAPYTAAQPYCSPWRSKRRTPAPFDPSPERQPATPDAKRAHPAGADEAPGDTRWVAAHCSVQGLRPEMEDLFFATPGPVDVGGRSLAFYAVFDGHGGRRAAEIASMRLWPVLRAMLAKGLRAEHAMAYAFAAVDGEIAAETAARLCGCTVVCALVDAANLEAVVAHAGDARCLLLQSDAAPNELTEDHVPARASERARVVACGGAIEFGRVNGCLAVTRALGDWGEKIEHPGALLGAPEVTRVSLAALADDPCAYMLLSCDGLFESRVRAPDVGAEVARLREAGTRDAEGLCRGLVEFALHSGSEDNITVLMVPLAEAAAERRDSPTPSGCTKPHLSPCDSFPPSPSLSSSRSSP
jgi:protein phosphatase 2C family protein 2/3